MLQIKHQITAFMHVMNISKFCGLKIWSKVVPVHVMKAYEGMELELCPFLASAPVAYRGGGFGVFNPPPPPPEIPKISVESLIA